jgi:uncharacterized sulfatase
MPNVVFICTDTTNRHHLGCYGCDAASTPHQDALARNGLRFDNAYSASPVCTAARGCMFSGCYAPVNGATYNDATPYSNVQLMGSIAAAAGVCCAYAGKWHLDGGLYNGYGTAQGGFPQRWWYDGACYVDDIGPDKAAQWKQFGRSDFPGKLKLAFAEEDCWGHRVADRAIDFLEHCDGSDPFLLCVAFDEPHSPFMCPRRFLEAVDPERAPLRPNMHPDPASLSVQRRATIADHDNTEADIKAYWRYYAACNSFVDYEIGRVVAAVKRLHGEDTVIICTTDHGEQMASHGTWGKGYVPYQECLHIPLLINGPGVATGQSTVALSSQIDYLPTICDLLGIDTPAQCQGSSLVPILQDPRRRVRDFAVFTHDRFGNQGEPGRYPDRRAEDQQTTQQQKQAFYPMRGIVDGRLVP